MTEQDFNPQQLRQMADQLENQQEEKGEKEPLKLNRTVEEKVIENEWTKTPKPFNLFSPSQVGYCKRQLYNRKHSLTSVDRYVKGILHAGTVNHFWLEHHLPELIEDRAIRTEARVKNKIEVPNHDFDIYVSGYADAVDTEGFVYDHKFTGNIEYSMESPKEKDRMQVLMYIDSLDDVHTGQLEYVQRQGRFQKGKIVEHTIEWDEEDFQAMVDKLIEVCAALKDRKGTELEEINPFSKCDCFYCKNEELNDRAKQAVQNASGDKQ